jgi:hypothetical protein
MASTLTQFLSTDVAPALLAASATASVAYSYRYSLARYGLLGYSYVKEALEPRPLVAPVLNAADSASEPGATVRLFPHIESIVFVYEDATTANRPTAVQEAALREAIQQWRARPVDNVCQHVSLYEALQEACAAHSTWATTALPSSIRITCDTLLMELTHTPAVVEMSDADGTVVCLARGRTNALRWPATIDPPSSPRPLTPPLPSA